MIFTFLKLEKNKSENFMEIKKENDTTIIYTGTNFPDDLEEGWTYYAVAEFEEQSDGSWKKVEEFDLEMKDDAKKT